jgi:CNT family concentrative nucleoside transporter
VAFSALISGAFSTFTSASIAGMVIIDESKYASSLSA